MIFSAYFIYLYLVLTPVRILVSLQTYTQCKERLGKWENWDRCWEEKLLPFQRWNCPQLFSTYYLSIILTWFHHHEVYLWDFVYLFFLLYTLVEAQIFQSRKKEYNFNNRPFIGNYFETKFSENIYILSSSKIITHNLTVSTYLWTKEANI